MKLGQASCHTGVKDHRGVKCQEDELAYFRCFIFCFWYSEPLESDTVLLGLLNYVRRLQVQEGIFNPSPFKNEWLLWLRANTVPMILGEKFEEENNSFSHLCDFIQYVQHALLVQRGYLQRILGDTSCSKCPSLCPMRHIKCLEKNESYSPT